MIVGGTRMERKIRSQITRFVAMAAMMTSTCTLQAGSATWNLNPVNNRWTKAANWTPETVPYGSDNTASFAASVVTDVMLGDTPDGYASNVVDGISFAEDADAYTIILSTRTQSYHSTQLAFVGSGIINNSGVVQNFIAKTSSTKDSGQIFFSGIASAGENVVITNEGGTNAVFGQYGAFTAFWDSSTAANATFINDGSTTGDTIYGGFTNLIDFSSAANATFINNPGSVSGAAAGHTLVGTSTPGNIGTSTFINNAATVAGADGGWTEIDGGVSDGASFLAKGATVADAQGGQVYAFGGDGYSTYTAEGGNGINAQGGLIDVLYVPASIQTVVTAKAGTNGGFGGTILIEDSADIPLPQFQVSGNGMLDLTNVTDPTMPIGSLAGDGVVLLAGHELSVGNNNLSTTFSGVIQESGGLTKAGTGTLTLTGASTYIGTTTVSAGVLVVSNRSGSGTGTGPVNINAGTLGGKGIISGAVTIGTGSGIGAFLAPGVASNEIGKLTLKKTLTFKSDSTYIYKLNTNNARTDLVRAKGIIIESGAHFAFQPKGNHALMPGTVFTVLSNVSTVPITGTFANLADNSTFTVGRNNYQVNYEGGDGNDLTLTVVP
jgi:autotransporter-associated beta strand protein